LNKSKVTSPRKTTARSYDGSGRQRDAERRRQRILTAATELFREQGYGATSIDQIAQRADVAAPTVYAAFGSKAAVLKRLIDISITGDEDDVPLLERPEYDHVIAGEGPAVTLERLAALSVTLNERGAWLVRLLSSVAGTEPSLAELEREYKRQIRVQAEAAVQLIPPDRLRTGVPRKRLIDETAFYLSPWTWNALVVDLGWSSPVYRRWLAESLIRTLIGEQAAERTSGA
jgi:AcrR family transcriptional regulator